MYVYDKHYLYYTLYYEFIFASEVSTEPEIMGDQYHDM